MKLDLPARFARGGGRSGTEHRLGFTLIELMIVVAIMGIVMTIAIPSIYRQTNPDSMRKAVSDMVEACSNARARAILDGRFTEMTVRPAGVQVPGFSARLSEKIGIEEIWVNYVDLKQEEEAKVRFYPNGTSDEFTVILHRIDTDEWCKITLEVVTGLADAEYDRTKWLK